MLVIARRNIVCIYVGEGQAVKFDPEGGRALH